MSNWNRRHFSIYDSDERSTLKLIEELNEINKEVSEKTVENINDIERLKNDKLSKLEYENDITNNRKLSNTGDFTGTWFGLKKPTLSEEGANAQIEKNKDDIKELQNIFNTFGSLKLISPDGTVWYLCVDNFGQLGVIKGDEK